MGITIQEITSKDRWNGFLLSQSRPHLLQSYEWGELNQYLGGKVYRLCALDDKEMVGAMMLVVSPIAGARLPFKWLYSSRGPTVAQPASPALTALVEYAQKVLARKEHAVALRLEPNIADDDPAMEDWLVAYRNLGFRTNPY